MQLSNSKQKLALNLLHLLYVNKLEYDAGWESWISYLIDTDNEWTVIDYPQLLNVAALIASGLTKKRASMEETKVLLAQIERWVTESNGRLVEVTESKRRTKWYPVCLVRSDRTTSQSSLSIGYSTARG